MCALMAVLLSLPNRMAAAVPPPSSDVKAIFTYNFLEFVKWPATAFKSPQDAFVIGVHGDAEMLRLLKKTAEGERLGEHPVRVVPVDNPTQAESCHILYLAAGSERLLRGLPAGRPILTIGETDAFVAGNGVIRFLTERNRIKVQINLAAARSAGLDVSSRLLRIAEVIGGPP